MSKLVNGTFDLLGMKVEDKISGVKGVVTSICFDLYGCVQVSIHQGLDKEGKPRENFWYDVQRLKVLSIVPIMSAPNFRSDNRTVPTYNRGPAEKAPAKF